MKKYITHEPFPGVIYYSGPMFWRLDRDETGFRPLTVTGLIRGIGGNFVRMNYWRFMRTLRILGLLSTPEMAQMRWGHFTLRVHRHQMWHRLRIVRLVKKYARRWPV